MSEWTGATMVNDMRWRTEVKANVLTGIRQAARFLDWQWLQDRCVEAMTADPEIWAELEQGMADISEDDNLDFLKHHREDK